MWKVKQIFLQYAIVDTISDDLIKKYPNWKDYCKEEIIVEEKPKQEKVKKTKKSKK